MFEATASPGLAMADFDGLRQAVSGDTIVTARKYLRKRRSTGFLGRTLTA